MHKLCTTHAQSKDNAIHESIDLTGSPAIEGIIKRWFVCSSKPSLETRRGTKYPVVQANAWTRYATAPGICWRRKAKRRKVTCIYCNDKLRVAECDSCGEILKCAACNWSFEVCGIGCCKDCCHQDGEHIAKCDLCHENKKEVNCYTDGCMTLKCTTCDWYNKCDGDHGFCEDCEDDGQPTICSCGFCSKCTDENGYCCKGHNMGYCGCPGARDWRELVLLRLRWHSAWWV